MYPADAMDEPTHNGGEQGGLHDGLVRAARLAHLDLSPEQLVALCADAGRTLGHVARMGEMDLEGVEPLVHPHDGVGTLAPDEPAGTLPTEDLMGMAPEAHPPYVKVPKVIDEGGS